MSFWVTGRAPVLGVVPSLLRLVSSREIKGTETHGRHRAVIGYSPDDRLAYSLWLHRNGPRPDLMHAGDMYSMPPIIWRGAVGVILGPASTDA